MGTKKIEANRIQLALLDTIIIIMGTAGAMLSIRLIGGNDPYHLALSCLIPLSVSVVFHSVWHELQRHSIPKIVYNAIPLITLGIGYIVLNRLINDIIKNAPLHMPTFISTSEYITLVCVLSIYITTIAIYKPKAILIASSVVYALMSIFRITDINAYGMLLFMGACSLLLLMSLSSFHDQSSSESTSSVISRNAFAAVMTLLLMISVIAFSVYALFDIHPHSYEPISSSTSSTVETSNDPDKDNQVGSTSSTAQSNKESEEDLKKEKKEDSKSSETKEPESEPYEKPDNTKQSLLDIIGIMIIPAVIIITCLGFILSPIIKKQKKNRRILDQLSNCSDSVFPNLAFRYLIKYLHTAGIDKSRPSSTYRSLTHTLADKFGADLSEQFEYILNMHEESFYGDIGISAEKRQNAMSALERITDTVYGSSSRKTRLKLIINGYK